MIDESIVKTGAPRGPLVQSVAMAKVFVILFQRIKIVHSHMAIVVCFRVCCIDKVERLEQRHIVVVVVVSVALNSGGRAKVQFEQIDQEIVLVLLF